VGFHARRIDEAGSGVMSVERLVDASEHGCNTPKDCGWFKAPTIKLSVS
jgi:hypothetical protein